MGVEDHHRLGGVVDRRPVQRLAIGRFLLQDDGGIGFQRSDVEGDADGDEPRGEIGDASSADRLIVNRLDDAWRRQKRQRQGRVWEAVGHRQPREFERLSVMVIARPVS